MKSEFGDILNNQLVGHVSAKVFADNDVSLSGIPTVWPLASVANPPLPIEFALNSMAATPNIEINVPGLYMIEVQAAAGRLSVDNPINVDHAIYVDSGSGFAPVTIAGSISFHAGLHRGGGSAYIQHQKIFSQTDKIAIASQIITGIGNCMLLAKCSSVRIWRVVL